MKQTQWFRRENFHVGDVVLFKKVDSVISRNHVWRVIDVIPGADGNVFQVRVESLSISGRYFSLRRAEFKEAALRRRE